MLTLMYKPNHITGLFVYLFLTELCLFELKIFEHITLETNKQNDVAFVLWFETLVTR